MTSSIQVNPIKQHVKVFIIVHSSCSQSVTRCYLPARLQTTKQRSRRLFCCTTAINATSIQLHLHYSLSAVTSYVKLSQRQKPDAKASNIITHQPFISLLALGPHQQLAHQRCITGVSGGCDLLRWHSFNNASALTYSKPGPGKCCCCPISLINENHWIKLI